LEDVKTPMPPPVESVSDLNGMFKQSTLVDLQQEPLPPNNANEWAEVRDLENLELGPATPSPPIYPMEQQFSFVQQQQPVFSAPMDHQLIHHNGMVYSAQPPPAMCSHPYPVVMMNHPHPAHMAHPNQLYSMGPPMGHPPSYNGGPASQGMPAQQIFYPPTSAFYYVYPPPADMVNA
jgi:hypothetical protein